MNDSAKVALTCGNRLLREAIARLLIRKVGFEVAMPHNTQSASAESNILDADVFVFDSLDSFSASLRPSIGADSSIKCVLIGMEDNHEHFFTAIQSGARGYVLRDASAMDVVHAIRAVAQGKAVCPPPYMAMLFGYIAAQVEKSMTADPQSNCDLTRREQQIVPLLDRGITNKEIAERLCISEQTVKNHVYRMMRKTRASNRREMCAMWRRQSAPLPSCTDETRARPF